LNDIDVSENARLIAIMLGVLHMNIDQCIEEWEKLAPNIFPNKKGTLNRLAMSSVGGAPYSEKPLEVAIKGLVEKYIGDRGGPGNDPPLAFEATDDRKSPRCKV
jgi:hypothetical protein